MTATTGDNDWREYANLNAVMEDPEFGAWAERIARRWRNAPLAVTEGAMREAVLCEGTRPPEWMRALAFLMRFAEWRRSQKARRWVARRRAHRWR